MQLEQSGPGPIRGESEASRGSHTRKDDFILHDQLAVGTQQTLVSALPEFLWSNSTAPSHLLNALLSILWLCLSYPAISYRGTHSSFLEHPASHSSASSPMNSTTIHSPALAPGDLPSPAPPIKASPCGHTAPRCPHTRPLPSGQTLEGCSLFFSCPASQHSPRALHLTVSWEPSMWPPASP